MFHRQDGVGGQRRGRTSSSMVYKILYRMCYHVLNVLNVLTHYLTYVCTYSMYFAQMLSLLLLLLLLRGFKIIKLT